MFGYFSLFDEEQVTASITNSYIKYGNGHMHLKYYVQNFKI